MSSRADQNELPFVGEIVEREITTATTSGHCPATPSPLPWLATLAALLAIKQRTLAMWIQRKRPFGVAGHTPLPTTPQIPGARAQAVAPPTPTQPSGNTSPVGFSPKATRPALARVCSPGCRALAEGSNIRSAHRIPCLKSNFKGWKSQYNSSKEASKCKSKCNWAGCRESVRHTRHSGC